jgi:hypothetical protein
MVLLSGCFHDRPSWLSCAASKPGERQPTCIPESQIATGALNTSSGSRAAGLSQCAGSAGWCSTRSLARGIPCQASPESRSERITLCCEALATPIGTTGRRSPPALHRRPPNAIDGPSVASPELAASVQLLPAADIRAHHLFDSLVQNLQLKRWVKEQFNHQTGGPAAGSRPGRN